MLQDLPIRAKKMFKTIRTVLEDLPIQPKKIFKQIRDVSSWNDESCPTSKTKDVGEEKQNLPEKASDAGEEKQNLPEKTAGPDLDSIPEDVGEEKQNLSENTSGPDLDSIPEGRRCRLFSGTFKFVLITTCILQSLVPAAATDDNLTAVVLNIQADNVVFGETLVIVCEIADTCKSTSWSVRKPHEGFETVVRKNKTFDSSKKYEAHVDTKDNRTITTLKIFQFDGKDEHAFYRCECDSLFESSNLTDINDKLKFMNASKNKKDSQPTTDGWVIAVIVVLLVLCTIAVIARVICYCKKKQNPSMN